MGQHKFNQTAIDAKEGKLPPKKKRMSKRERDYLIHKMIYEKTGLNDIQKCIGNNCYSIY